MIPPGFTRMTCDKHSGEEVRTPVDKQILALDALSKLTREFCDTPDFERLIDVLMLTLCGQFAVADVFALLRRPSLQSLNQSFFATGRYKRDVMLASLPVTAASHSARKKAFSRRRACSATLSTKLTLSGIMVGPFAVVRIRAVREPDLAASPLPPPRATAGIASSPPWKAGTPRGLPIPGTPRRPRSTARGKEPS